MRYALIRRMDISNGEGVGIALFVQGCHFRCKGCFNQDTWDFEKGKPWTTDIENKFLELADKPYISRISILGGEPFEPSNQRELIKLIRRVGTELPERDIWVYTGFTYDKDLVPGGCRYTEVTDEILDRIDILVDGRFIQEQKNLALRFRGSENQRIIDMKKTRAEGKLCLAQID